MKKINACLFIWGSENTKTIAQVPPDRIAKIYFKRIGNGELKWCGTLYPIHLCPGSRNVS